MEAQSAIVIPVICTRCEQVDERGRVSRGAVSCIALTLRTIWSRPVALADALSRFQVVGAMLGAAGQALVHLLINGAAILALPAGLAIALPGHAGAMAGAQWIKAIICTIPNAVGPAGRLSGVPGGPHRRGVVWV